MFLSFIKILLYIDAFPIISEIPSKTYTIKNKIQGGLQDADSLDFKSQTVFRFLETSRMLAPSSEPVNNSIQKRSSVPSPVSGERDAVREITPVSTGVFEVPDFVEFL